jgi:hypothetical protein
VNPIRAIGRLGWHHCLPGQRPGSVRHRPAALLGEPATAARLEKVPAAARPGPVRAALADGMPAWQIIVIAASAALLAAAVAVTAYRMRAAWRRVTQPPPETRPRRPHPPHAN